MALCDVDEEVYQCPDCGKKLTLRITSYQDGRVSHSIEVDGQELDELSESSEQGKVIEGG